MKPKMAAMSALVAYVGQRSLRLVTMLFLATVVASLSIIWAMGYFLSEWWWVLAVPIILAVIIFLVLRIAIKQIISMIHRHPFTTKQREHLEAFTSKIRRLAEARSIPVPLYAAKTLRELLRDRDATSVRQLVSDTESLKDDFAELEKHFGER